MDEACAYAQLQLLHGFCPLVLFRGADSVREFEQICLVNPQHHRTKVDSSCENTPAKVQKFYETESHNAKKVAKRDENSSFEGQNGSKTTNFTTNNVQQRYCRDGYDSLYPCSSISHTQSYSSHTSGCFQAYSKHTQE